MSEVFDSLAESLADLGAVRAQMMGRQCLKVGSSMFAVSVEDGLVLKLGRETAEFADALELEGSEVWRPGGGERRFHDWVHLQETTADVWERFSEASLEYVARL